MSIRFIYIVRRFKEKAEEHGIEVKEVSEYETSSVCPICRSRNAASKGRLFKCLSCGLEAHRDAVGVLNIALLCGGEVNGVVAHPLLLRWNGTMWEPKRAVNNRADENLRSKNLPALAVESVKSSSMASRKGVSPIFASILLIMIVVASASVIYSSVTRLTATGPYQTSDLLEDLKIINVAADSDHVYIYTLNRGGIDAVVDSVYVEAPSGTLLMRVPVYYNVSAGEIVRIAIPRGGLDLSAPLNFKLATKRGTIASSLELVKYNIIPTIPSLLTYYPSLCNIITGSYVSGSLPSSVESVDGSYYTIASSPSFDSYEYHPSSFTVYQGSY
ncbi:MAG: zinc ribbon domain-containing protein, partial [Nitrososphaerota archaeon]